MREPILIKFITQQQTSKLGTQSSDAPTAQQRLYDGLACPVDYSIFA